MSHLASSPFTDYRTGSGGFILVTVLWILGALSALISIYALFVVNTASGFSTYEHRLRSDALVSAAVELAAYRHLATTGRSQSTQGQFSFRLGQANVAVDSRSEATRIDLNAAPKELLAGLFAALGARLDDAELYGNRIVSWRTPRPKGKDPDPAAYRSTGVGYVPRGDKFPHTGELFLVDLPQIVAERALPFVTVYGGPQVNIIGAAPQVIAALPGLTRERVDAVQAHLRLPQATERTLLPLLGAAQKYVTFDKGNTLRLTVRVAFDNGRRTSADVVILVFDQGDAPYAVLTRRDDQDQWRSASASEAVPK